MHGTEPDLRTVEEARRRSAAKVRSLLEQLEAAEKEFDALTKKFKALSEATPPRNEVKAISASQ